MPTVEELQDPGTLGKLAQARKLTITKITLGYGEGRYGETPVERTEQPISPFAKLECIAEIGEENLNCKFYCPILPPLRNKP